MAKVKGIEKHDIDFNDVILFNQEAVMSRLNCHNIGRIIEFDSTTQTCTIELMQLKQMSSEIIIPAPLTEVPLIVYGSGDASITLPNPVGTICLVLFLDRNMDAFMQTGEQYVPDTARMHDFTDCVALTTFRTLVNPIENYDENSISINYQNSTIKTKDEIEINSKGDITISSPTKIILDTPEVETSGSLSVATGYTGVIPCGAATIQVTNGIITGVS